MFPRDLPRFSRIVPRYIRTSYYRLFLRQSDVGGVASPENGFELVLRKPKAFVVVAAPFRYIRRMNAIGWGAQCDTLERSTKAEKRAPSPTPPSSTNSNTFFPHVANRSRCLFKWSISRLTNNTDLVVVPVVSGRRLHDLPSQLGQEAAVVGVARAPQTGHQVA